MSDEGAMRLLATCSQQVVHVGLVEFGERHSEQHDTRTNGKALYTAAGLWPTNQVSAWQDEQGSRPTRLTRATFS